MTCSEPNCKKPKSVRVLQSQVYGQTSAASLSTSLVGVHCAADKRPTSLSCFWSIVSDALSSILRSPARVAFASLFTLPPCLHLQRCVSVHGVFGNYIPGVCAFTWPYSLLPLPIVNRCSLLHPGLTTGGLNPRSQPAFPCLSPLEARSHSTTSIKSCAH